MASAAGFITVGSGTSVSSITHTLGTSSIYVTATAPHWNTTVWVGSWNPTSATLYLGTQAGSGGGRVDWRAET